MTARSQVIVDRSKDKVVIGGESFYIHIVKKGETYYSISKAYGITTEQLAAENPSAGMTIKEGQSLRIPVKLVSDTPAAPPAQIPVFSVHDNARFIYHKLSHGETVYFLSKKYNVTEQDIIGSNPGIDITKLPLGAEIAIPRKTETEITNKAIQDNEYYHKVTSGETLSSIARQYGISLRDLKRANRDVRFPRVGDYVKIPGLIKEVKRHPESVAIDTLTVIKEEEPDYLGRPSEYTPVNNLRGFVDVAVLLPFYLRENAERDNIDSSKTVKGKVEYRKTERPGDWIYPASVEFVEMYDGILLAADTLRSLGLNVNIHTWDIKSDTSEMIQLVNSGSLDNMDLIIGPVYSGNLSIVAAFAGKHEIPVVSPVPLFSNSVLNNNPYLFLAGASLEVAQKAIARKAGEYPDHNFVLIYSSNDDLEGDIGNFKKMITEELVKRTDLVKVKGLTFYSRSEYGLDSVKRLNQSLSEKGGNVVIIASENPPVMSEAIMEVRNLSRKYDLKVFGYPEMLSLSNIDPKFFFDLGLMVYSPSWIDYSSDDIVAFNSDFREKFFTEPSELSYAWQGYDIAYYFLSGLSIHGKQFILHPEIHNPDLLHTEFDFRRKNSDSGFENQKLYLIKFTNDYEVEKVEEISLPGSQNNF
jgi:LysM repeat protein